MKRTDHIALLSRDLTPLGPQSVTPQVLLEWAATKIWSAETRHSYYCSIRQFFTFLTGTADNVSTVLPKIRRQIPPPRPAPESVLQEALKGAPEREALIMMLAAMLGLRAHEIVQVHSDAITEDLLGYSLRVTGKGGAIRDIPLPPRIAHKLIIACSAGNGWAFPGQVDGHLSAQWASKLAGQYLPSPWSLHTLRHRFATRAYSAERDLLTVQRLLGHRSVATTQRYARPPQQATIAAINAALPDEWTFKE